MESLRACSSPVASNSAVLERREEACRILVYLLCTAGLGQEVRVPERPSPAEHVRAQLNVSDLAVCNVDGHPAAVAEVASGLLVAGDVGHPVHQRKPMTAKERLHGLAAVQLDLAQQSKV